MSIELFMQKVQQEPNTGCWIWTGALSHNGYGLFGNGKERRAHRYSYVYHKGEIPDGMVICHTCDNRMCVSPYHLFADTQKSNVQDCIRKKRFKAGEHMSKRETCSHGHAFDEQNTVLTKHGYRQCRTCNNIKARKHRLTNKEKAA